MPQADPEFNECFPKKYDSYELDYSQSKYEKYLYKIVKSIFCFFVVIGAAELGARSLREGAHHTEPGDPPGATRHRQGETGHQQEQGQSTNLVLSPMIIWIF